MDARIVPDGTPGEPPESPPSQSQSAYQVYLDAVTAADIQYDHAVNVDAPLQAHAAMDAANALLPGQDAAAYASYLSSSTSAYALYQSRESDAKAQLLSIVNQANATLSSAINQAWSAVESAVTSAGSAAESAFNTAFATMSTSFSGADSAFQTSSQTAWDSGDFLALQAAEQAWYAAFTAAVDSYNSTYETTAIIAEAALGDAVSTFTAAVDSAEQAWTMEVQSAYDLYQSTEWMEWYSYTTTEGSSWDEYMSARAAIGNDQWWAHYSAMAGYDTDVSIALAAYMDTETQAWAEYLYTLTPDVVPGGRFESPSTMPAQLVLSMVLLADPGARAVNPHQGQPPPIDWSKNVVQIEKMHPWDGSSVYGPLLKTQIGVDAGGTPVYIYSWQPVGTGVLQYRYQYFCHGLTFGGATQAHMSVEGGSVPKILEKFYKSIPQSDVKAGDIFVWTNLAGVVGHSCILVTPVFKPDGTLDTTLTIVNTKNGSFPEQQMTLAQVMGIYLAQGFGIVTPYTRK